MLSVEGVLQKRGYENFAKKTTFDNVSFLIKP